MATAQSDDGDTADEAKKPASGKKSGKRKSGSKSANKPKADKPGPKKSATKKSGAQTSNETAPSAVGFKAAGTFMPNEDDPLDTPDPAVAMAAAQLARDDHHATPVSNTEAGADAGTQNEGEAESAPPSPRTKASSVEELERRRSAATTNTSGAKTPSGKTSSVEELDRLARLRAAFDLDTDEENDFARAALVVAGTATIALVAILKTALAAAIYAGIVALAVASGLFAVYLGFRGYRSAVRGVATNSRLSLLAILVGSAVVATTLVVLVYRAVTQ